MIATRAHRFSFGVLLAVGITMSVVALLFTSADPAQAAPPSGLPVADLPLGSAGKGLRAPGVKVSAIKPLSIRSGIGGFPISDVAVNGPAAGSLVLRGGLKLKRKRRSVKLTGLLVSVRNGRVAISGRIDRKRMTLFTGRVSGTPTFDASRSAVAVSSKRLTMTTRAARLIKSRLRSRAPRSRTLGRFAASAAAIPPPFEGGVIDPGEAAKCNTAVSPVVDPGRPVGAVDLTCGFLTWQVRDSWIDYLEMNPPITPAVALTPISGNQHVCPDAGASAVDAYGFSMKLTGGWWDASSGRAALFATGGVHFRFDSHFLNIQATDLELRIDGANSVLKVTIIDSSNPSGTRIEFATVNPAPIAGGPVAPGTALSRVRTNLTAAGDTAIGNGFYGVGEGFGCVDFGFNV